MTTIKSILEELTIACSRNSVISVTDRLVDPLEAINKNIKLVDQAVAQIEQLIEEANVTLNEVDVPANIDAYHYAVDILKIHKDNLKKVIR